MLLEEGWIVIFHKLPKHRTIPHVVTVDQEIFGFVHIRFTVHEKTPRNRIFSVEITVKIILRIFRCLCYGVIYFRSRNAKNPHQVRVFLHQFFVVLRFGS